MQRQPVESTNIVSVGWDPQTKTMEIEFHGGGIYQYTGGPVEQRYKDLMAAASKGKFFTQHIRRDPAITVKRIS